MKKRREMKQDGNLNHIEFREVCKTVRKKIREDFRQFQIKEITERIKDNENIKKAKQQLSIGEKRISCVLSKSGEPITGQDQITKILTLHLTRVLDENQPIQQAGFRSGYSTIDLSVERKMCRISKATLPCVASGISGCGAGW